MQPRFRDASRKSRARARTKKVEQLVADAIATAEDADEITAFTAGLMDKIQEDIGQKARIGGPKVSSKNFETAGRERLLPDDSVGRKRYPMCTGLLDYFPDAMTAISKVSFDATQQHHPGEGMHWDRDKSPDHADCILRHLTERGGFDGKGNRHSVLLAWRALALAQVELEAEFEFDVSRASTFGAEHLPPR